MEEVEEGGPGPALFHEEGVEDVGFAREEEGTFGEVCVRERGVQRGVEYEGYEDAGSDDTRQQKSSLIRRTRTGGRKTGSRRGRSGDAATPAMERWVEGRYPFGEWRKSTSSVHARIWGCTRLARRTS